MGDEYEDLVELGFEGVDRFATHFHDPVAGFVGKHKPFSWHSKKKPDAGSTNNQKERQRELPEEEKPPPQRTDSPQSKQEPLQQSYLPPHPQWQVPPPPQGRPPAASPYAGRVPAIPVVPTTPYYPAYPVPQPTGLPSPPGQPQRRQLPRQRSYSEPRDERYGSRSVPDNIGEIESDSEIDRGPKSMYSDYVPDRRREGRWRDDDRYERTVEDREYSGPGGTVQQMVVRTRDANRYQGAVVPRAPSPPPDDGYAQRSYADGWAVRGRPLPHRQRSSSWSPPRRPERRHDTPPRRERSRSPNHHRALAVVMGALVGGVAGSRVKKSDPVPNTVATVGGAILGGIAAREIEQEYDKHKARRTHQAYERGEARERRRLEREYDYD